MVVAGICVTALATNAPQTAVPVATLCYGSSLRLNPVSSGLAQDNGYSRASASPHACAPPGCLPRLSSSRGILVPANGGSTFGSSIRRIGSESASTIGCGRKSTLERAGQSNSSASCAILACRVCRHPGRRPLSRLGLQTPRRRCPPNPTAAAGTGSDRFFAARPTRPRSLHLGSGPKPSWPLNVAQWFLRDRFIVCSLARMSPSRARPPITRLFDDPRPLVSSPADWPSVDQQALRPVGRS